MDSDHSIEDETDIQTTDAETTKDRKIQSRHSTQTKLTAAERDYWWRLTHNLISTKKKESKWKREESGELVKDKCPVCKEEAEDMPHYNYGCGAMQEFMERVARKAEEGREGFNREEWNLREEGMKEETMVLIATARWVYHCERCKIDRGRRKRMNIEVVMNRLERRMNITAT